MSDTKPDLGFDRSLLRDDSVMFGDQKMCYWRVSPGHKAILFREADNEDCETFIVPKLSTSEPKQAYAEVHNGVYRMLEGTSFYCLPIKMGEYKEIV